MIQPIAERISNENDTVNEIVNEIAIRSIPKQVYNTYKDYPSSLQQQDVSIW